MSKSRDRLRIAVQKSGRLSDASQELLARAGMKFRMSRDKLFCYGESLPIDLLLVRDDDIPSMIAQGVCELGFVGANVAREQALGLAVNGEPILFQELIALGFGACRLSLAIPADEEYVDAQIWQGKRIATSYPNLLRDYLSKNEVTATAVVLNGSVEIAPRLGTADYICDLVSSGATLAANQLKEVAIVMQSEAVLIGTTQALHDERGGLLQTLLRRVEGVIRVRESKLIMLQADRANIPAIINLLPNADLPTLTRVEAAGERLSLQAVCHASIGWTHLEELKRAGASHLLVLPVEKMLA
jgi:ATP phosphoribosyltransferase